MYATLERLILSTPPTTPPPTTTTPPVTHLPGVSGTLALWLIVGLVIAAGLVIIAGRYWLTGQRTDHYERKQAAKAKSKATTTDIGTQGRAAATTDSSKQAKAPDDAHAATEPRGATDRTLVRSWLAISLVGGLLVFCAVSFGLDDTTLRSTLIGGLVANAGAAVAFYFASTAAAETRRDILSATFPSVVVPSLVGKTQAEVNEIVASMPLHLEPPATPPIAEAKVSHQSPRAGSAVPMYSRVSIVYGSVVALPVKVPNLTGRTFAAAKADLEAVGLALDSSIADPGPTAVAGTDQQPAADANAPPGTTVTVTFG